MKISQVTPNPTIASFIQTYVSERPSYTNKLPLDDEQALFTFLEEAADETGLFVVEEADEIQMLLLCISYSEDRYKVIGPIVKTVMNQRKRRSNNCSMLSQHNITNHRHIILHLQLNTH